MIEVITVKFDRDKELFQTDVLKKFVLNKKINSYKPEFFQDGGSSYWTVFIDFDVVIDKNTGQKNDKDFKLTEEESLLLTRLKEWRNVKAEEKGYPGYIIATNSQLVTMIKNKSMTLESLKSIKGFGGSRIENYGNDIVSLIKNFYEIEKEKKNE